MAKSTKKESFSIVRIVIGGFGGGLAGIFVLLLITGFSCISDIVASLLASSIIALILGYFIGGKYGSAFAAVIAIVLTFLFICII